MGHDDLRRLGPGKARAPARVFAAVGLDKTRLIDNWAVYAPTQAVIPVSAAKRLKTGTQHPWPALRGPGHPLRGFRDDGGRIGASRRR